MILQILPTGSLARRTRETSACFRETKIGEKTRAKDSKRRRNAEKEIEKLPLSIVSGL